MSKDNILERADLVAAQSQFAFACLASRLHSQLAELGFRDYGEHGAQISGCVREHFPEELKDNLRELARKVTQYSDKGYSLRPYRVRRDTMRHLARSVATRDGSGFYGPQAYRKGA
jgi:hypothetical protein